MHTIVCTLDQLAAHPTQISGAFTDAVSASRIYREVLCLRCCHHCNILRLLSIIAPPSDLRDFHDVYVVTPASECDLLQILQGGHRFSRRRRRWITLQIIRGLAYLHAGGVCHGDLKPANVFIQDPVSALHVVVGDLGHVQRLGGGAASTAAGTVAGDAATLWYFNVI